MGATQSHIIGTCRLAKHFTKYTAKHGALEAGTHHDYSTLSQYIMVVHVATCGGLLQYVELLHATHVRLFGEASHIWLYMWHQCLSCK
jgi:hypothetical protein